MEGRELHLKGVLYVAREVSEHVWEVWCCYEPQYCVMRVEGTEEDARKGILHAHRRAVKQARSRRLPAGHVQSGRFYPRRRGEVIEVCSFGESGSDFRLYGVMGISLEGNPVVDPGDGSLRVLEDPMEWGWPERQRHGAGAALKSASRDRVFVWYSKRGHPLVYVGGTRDQPVLTVENYPKWYGFCLVTPRGIVLDVSYGELEGLADEAGTFGNVDHAPNAELVPKLASARGWILDSCSYEMIVGRWETDGMGTKKYDY